MGGGTPSTKISNYWNGKINWYSPSEIGYSVYVNSSKIKISEEGLKHSSAKLLPGNQTILFTSRAGIGDMAIMKTDGTTNQGFQSWVIDPSKTNIYFLFSMGNLVKKEAIKKASGSTFLEISNSEVKNLNIKYPVKGEQDKIGKLLSKLDKTISLLQKEVKLKTLLKRDLLQNLLTITENNAPKIRLKNYNDIWKSTTLGEVAKIKTGARNHQDSVPNGKYPFFVRSEKIEHLNEYDFDERAILVPGDGKIGEIFHYYQGKFALHQRVYKIDDFKNIEPLFLLNLFKNNFKRHALRLNAQGTVPSLRLPMFTKWKINLPSFSEQKRIASLLNNIDKSIESNKKKIQSFAVLKQFLLQNMFI